MKISDNMVRAAVHKAAELGLLPGVNFKDAATWRKVRDVVAAAMDAAPGPPGWRWWLHRGIIHPACEVLRRFGLRRLACRLHDATLPTHRCWLWDLD